jgi:hypothetical protein
MHILSKDHDIYTLKRHTQTPANLLLFFEKQNKNIKIN